jgi:hypothetical protein
MRVICGIGHRRCDAGHDDYGNHDRLNELGHEDLLDGIWTGFPASVCVDFEMTPGLVTVALSFAPECRHGIRAVAEPLSR